MTSASADRGRRPRPIIRRPERALTTGAHRSSQYAFTNRRRDKIELLCWEDGGFVLYYRSLAEEKFRWPHPNDAAMPLTAQQINWLLDGYDIGLMQGHKKLQYGAVF